MSVGYYNPVKLEKKLVNPVKIVKLANPVKTVKLVNVVNLVIVALIVHDVSDLWCFLR